MHPCPFPLVCPCHRTNFGEVIRRRGKAELGCNYFPLFLSLFPFAFDGAHHIVNGSARGAASWMRRSDDRCSFVTRRVSLCDLSRHRNRQQQKVRDTALGGSPTLLDSSHCVCLVASSRSSCTFPNLSLVRVLSPNAVFH